jgi:hypothetical protein
VKFGLFFKPLVPKTPGRMTGILARQIMPEFRAREAGHQTWRKQQMEGIAHPIVTSV